MSWPPLEVVDLIRCGRSIHRTKPPLDTLEACQSATAIARSWRIKAVAELQ